jgi:type II secretory pathway pseudopilin PulG
METVLIVITIISAAVAVFGLTSAKRAQRRERERSEARVAALSAAADTHSASDGGWRQVAGEWQWAAEPQAVPVPAANLMPDLGPVFASERPTPVPERATPVSERATPVSERVIRVTEPIPNPQSPIPIPGPAGTSERLFATVDREERSGSRLPMLAAAALIVMVGGALIFLNTSASNDHAATVAQGAHGEPLELVSLGHAREVAQLTISGTVRNPSTGAKLEGLTAVVSLLDRAGALVLTKDVPLDYRALSPGEEAPFKVSIPDPGSIARYRVSFRAGSDVVPHVDRRPDTKLASALQ